jgi:hypothetical protein
MHKQGHGAPHEFWNSFDPHRLLEVMDLVDEIRRRVCAPAAMRAGLHQLACLAAQLCYDQAAARNAAAGVTARPRRVS